MRWERVAVVASAIFFLAAASALAAQDADKGEMKAGERVRLRWIREENRLVAESIAIIAAKAP